MKTNGLTLQQQKAVTALVEGLTVAEAAKRADCTERAIYKWLQSLPEFKEAVDSGVSRAYDAAIEKAVMASSSAITFLSDLVKDEEASNRDRIAACKEIMANADKFKQKELDERLARLETLLELESD